MIANLAILLKKIPQKTLIHSQNPNQRSTLCTQMEYSSVIQNPVARQLVARGSTTVERHTWISMHSDSPAQGPPHILLRSSYYYSDLFAIPILVLWVVLEKGTKILEAAVQFVQWSHHNSLYT